MKNYIIKMFDGRRRTEKVVQARSYEDATAPLRHLPPGYIWSCEPTE